jgi:hypothetical protein
VAALDPWQPIIMVVSRIRHSVDWASFPRLSYYRLRCLIRERLSCLMDEVGSWTPLGAPFLRHRELPMQKLTSAYRCPGPNRGSVATMAEVVSMAPCTTVRLVHRRCAISANLMSLAAWRRRGPVDSERCRDRFWKGRMPIIFCLTIGASTETRTRSAGCKLSMALVCEHAGRTERSRPLASVHSRGANHQQLHSPTEHAGSSKPPIARAGELSLEAGIEEKSRSGDG